MFLSLLCYCVFTFGRLQRKKVAPKHVSLKALYMDLGFAASLTYGAEPWEFYFGDHKKEGKLLTIRHFFLGTLNQPCACNCSAEHCNCTHSYYADGDLL